MTRPPCLTILAVALCLAGCGRGPGRAAVSGKVLVDREPLTEGAISFYPTDGNTGPSTGAVIHDGTYHISREQGAAIGKNRIEIRAFRKTGKKVRDPMARGAAQLTDEVVPAIAPEHATQVREIVAGDNTLDFDLPGTGAKK